MIDTNYKPDDFKDMLFNVSQVGDRSVFECFPILDKYKEFKQPVANLDINKVFKYIAYAYDKGSPLQRLEDIVKKKVTAGVLAGFEVNDKDRFTKYVDDIYLCRNNTVNLMIIRYCRLVRSRTYMVLAVGNETLYNTIKQLMKYEPKGPDADVLKETTLKMKMLSEAKELAKDMDATSFELLSEDNSAILNSVLYSVSDMTEEEYTNLTPEDFADKWVVDHPMISAKVDESESETLNQ